MDGWVNAGYIGAYILFAVLAVGSILLILFEILDWAAKKTSIQYEDKPERSRDDRIFDTVEEAQNELQGTAENRRESHDQ